MVCQKQPKVVFLCETLCKKDRVEWLRVSLGFEGCFAVDCMGHSGGVAMLWRFKEEASLLSYGHNHVDMEMSLDGHPRFRLTGFYGEPNRHLREDSWRKLRQLASASSLPWCLMGNLNNVLSNRDKRGGRPYPSWLINGFQETLLECSLVDMDLVGHQFTWERGRGSYNWVEVRLDRALVSESWLSLFVNARLHNLGPSISDHAPLWLSLDFGKRTPYTYRFRFENAWARDPLCRQIVQDGWGIPHSFSLTRKIKCCSTALAEWGRDINGKFKHKIARFKAILKVTQARRDESSVRYYKETQALLFETLSQQEIFWRQRSKQLWLQAGDLNTKYFHASANKRRRRNQVVSLKDENGLLRDWDSGLEKVMVDYFQNLFFASCTNWGRILDCVPTSISEDINLDLIKPVEPEEVKQALFQMHPDKSPGPDGFSPGFYQKFWDIVGEDIVCMVQEFFTTGYFPTHLSETHIVLIPKKSAPDSMGDLRPIALCKVVYKVVSKVMVNRLKTVLTMVISETQSAFVPGRLITDNIMVAFEVMHYLKRKGSGRDGFMALKLDMSKAYDRIEWGFLEAMMKKMGFGDHWVSLVMKCVSLVSYKIAIAGRELGPIVPSRGLRQGDPLSSYLFILCAEGFSALISKFVGDGKISGCKVAREAPVISHMLFAEDSYLFCRATMEEATHIKDILHYYQLASGQQINFLKSSVFFSTNTTLAMHQSLCTYLNISEAGPSSMYLGLPNTLGRNKSALLGFIKDKMRKKIEQWEGRFLSKAGKEILLKTVAQALPSYAMNVFLLPLGLCNDMEKLMCRYWWHSSSSGGRGVHWKKWEKLTVHKMKGGMGFRDLHDFNRSLLCKQGWRLINNPHSLVARLFKARYYKSGNFLDSKLGSNPSYIWRSVWEMRDLLKGAARCRVGNGESTMIQTDPWLNDAEYPWVISVHPALIGAKVSSLMQSDGIGWDVEVVNDLFNARDARCILSIPICPNRPIDNWVWSLEPSGFFTVKSCYKHLQLLKHGDALDLDKSFWKCLWQAKVPPKVKDLVWRASTGCLPTNFQLHMRHIGVDLKCPLCQSDSETTVHSLVSCTSVWPCWSRLEFRVTPPASESFATWLRANLDGKNEDQRAKIFMLCWAVWQRRNERVWRNKRGLIYGILLMADTTLQAWSQAQDRDVAPLPNLLTPADGRAIWCKPPLGSLKLNVDAAFFSEAATHSFAGIVRDHTGAFVEAFSCCRMGAVAPELGEAMGVWEALSWIKRRKLVQVAVETDSLMVVQALRSRISMASYFGCVIDECKQLWKDLSSVLLIL
ncbi:uncharacterized protein LOC133825790 [Humulus lupulus]|uniref:uncharacterized protein LOC133825790 n=1 Tax=Humulus lupulus TaxID=3486 RepID=UPI002B410B2E|nr:uncharacterized protein LOC133825790 [Humulus lupulus]